MNQNDFSNDVFALEHEVRPEKIEAVRRELYGWQAKNKICSYYHNIALDKFSKFDLITIISKLTAELFTKENKETDKKRTQSLL